MVTEAIVRTALRKIDDPELGHNIVDLGLIYEIKILPESGDLAIKRPRDQAVIVITMTLTTPGCPMGPFFVNQVKETVAAAAGLKPDNVNVRIVFEPPWSPEAMSPDLRLELGL